MKQLIHELINKSLNHSLNQFFSSLPEIKVIQIGANDGQRLDPVFSLIKRFNCKAILVEPMPYLCKKLGEKYPQNTNISILPVAITPLNNQGDLPFYHFEKKVGLPFSDDFTLWGSFSKDHLYKFKNFVQHFEELQTCSLIPTMGINDLLSSSGFLQVDYLQIDAEGFDEQLMSAIDFEKYQPYLIRFEHIHSNKTQVFKLLDKLQAAGYLTFSYEMDTICISKIFKRHFRLLSLIKLIHGNWLKPPKIT